MPVVGAVRIGQGEGGDLIRKNTRQRRLGHGDSVRSVFRRDAEEGRKKARPNVLEPDEAVELDPVGQHGVVHLLAGALTGVRSGFYSSPP